MHKSRKKRIAGSILIAFMMLFSMIPVWGGVALADETSITVGSWKNSAYAGNRTQFGYVMFSRNVGITMDNLAVKSSDETIAGADELEIVAKSSDRVNLFITAKKTGTIELTVYNKDNEEQCAKHTVSIKDGKMSATSMRIVPGDQRQLEFKLADPANDPSKTVWSSSDESIAAVDSTGLVTAKATGKCKITAVNGEWSGQCDVISHENGYFIGDKKIDKVVIEKTGKRSAIDYSGTTYYTDEHAAVEVWQDGLEVTSDYEWKLENTNVADNYNGDFYATDDPSDTNSVGMVNSSGRIMPVANGTTRVQLINYSYGEKIYEYAGSLEVVVTGCETTAPDQKENYTQVKDGVTVGWTYDRTKLTLKNHDGIMTDPANETEHANYITNEIDVDKAVFEFEFYNGEGKTTDQKMLENYKTEASRVKYEEQLKPDITLCDSEGNKIADAEDGLEITVDPLYTVGNNGQESAAASFTVKVDKSKLKKGSSYQLRFDPFANAPNLDLGDRSYMAEPIAYYFDTPAVDAESISISEDRIIMKEGETKQLTAEILPEDTTDKSVEWSSSDKSIATVGEDGVVTAVSEGKATITARTVNGLEAACRIKVEKKAGAGTDPAAPSGNGSGQQGGSSSATGDDMPVLLFAALMAAAAAAAAATFAVRRRADH